MCRALLYLGRPVLLDHLLYQPDSALVRQSFNPRMLHLLNLAGFGMLAWDRQSHASHTPWEYRSTALPVFDRNLKSMAGKVRASSLLAHVRGVAYSTEVNISLQNTHPFHFAGSSLALAHNGDLYRFAEIRDLLARHIAPQWRRQICGTTDSEWIAALIVSRLADPVSFSVEDLRTAIVEALAIISDARHEAGIHVSSSVNLFMSNGEVAAAVRYCFDFGRYRTDDPARVNEANLRYLSLWYTLGHDFGQHENEWKMAGGEDSADSILIASEPLTSDLSSWIEVPEYGLLAANMSTQRPEISTTDIRL